MGRTRRKRANKRPREYTTCEHDSELICFNSWLSRQGVERNSKLSLAVFAATGRGVLARRRLAAGEALVRLPLNATINVSTLLLDAPFASLFTENRRDCYSDYRSSVSFQSLLAFYLAFHAAQGKESAWHLYIKSLPKCYTVPYFLPEDLYRHLEPKMLSVISHQKKTILSAYNIFVEILKSSTSKHKQLFVDEFYLQSYEWAYFTINTRCVYMDLTKVIDVKNNTNNVLSLINDNTKIALCPYLDMINHSPKAKNEAKLILNRNLENIKVENVSKELFSDVTFSIYTNNCFEAHSQVFICYGDSYNIKLLTEYGFVLPSNELDCVTFDFEAVDSYLKLIKPGLSEDQINFIKKHGLDKDLYVDIKGLSFNLYALLMVVKYYYRENSDVSKIIYSSMEGFSESSDLVELLVPLLQERAGRLREAGRALRAGATGGAGGALGPILDNCCSVIQQYVHILEKFIK